MVQGLKYYAITPQPFENSITIKQTAGIPKITQVYYNLTISPMQT